MKRATNSGGSFVGGSGLWAGGRTLKGGQRTVGPTSGHVMGDERSIRSMPSKKRGTLALGTFCI